MVWTFPLTYGDECLIRLKDTRNLGQFDRVIVSAWRLRAVASVFSAVIIVEGPGDMHNWGF